MIRNAKRKLALLLAAVMLVGLLPTAAFAVDGTDPVGGTQVTEPSGGNTETTTPAPQPSDNTDTTTPPVETPPAEDTGDNSTTEPQPGEDTGTAEPQPTEPEPVAIDYADFLLNTASQGQPFEAGTLKSANFRIPALVTLSDGTLVAAADARWNHTYDGKNVDTMVSVSDNGGQSWTTSLVNYFADTEDKENGAAASFIDPALAADGQTVYLLVDVFPGGVNLIDGTCKTGTGYSENGLMLSDNGGSSYDYYVGTFSGGYAPVLKENGGTETGFAVNERYDLYTVSDDGVYTAVEYRKDDSYGEGAYVPANVFYQNATFTVFPTSYLWLVKSTDGGETWSAPQILNAQVKGDGEAFLGVGPGRGVVVGDTIYFSCYSHSGNRGDAASQRSSLIYSTDGGNTWTRTDSLGNADGGLFAKWSSENQAVQLNDGTIRMFFRNGRGTVCYADLNANGSWSSPVSLESTMASIGYQHICSTCQVSAIHYSQTINGKEALLVSCPSVLNSRTNGNIFVFTVNEDNSLTAAYSYQVNTGAFQYSCLTELSDGSIGILYEDGAASITYENIAIDVIAPGATIGNGETEAPQVTDKNGHVLDGTSVSLTTDGQPHTISVNVADDKALNAVSGNSGVVAVDVNQNDVTLIPVSAGSTTVTLTVSSLSRAAGDTATATLNVTVAANDVIVIEPAIDLFVGDSETVQVPDNVSGEEPVYGGTGIVTANVGSATSSTSDSGYLLGNSTTSLGKGTYVIASGSNALTEGLENTSGVSVGSVVDTNVVWKIISVSGGYRIQNVASQEYLYLRGYGSLSTTSNSSDATTWTWNNNHFFATFRYIPYYLRYNNGWTVTVWNDQASSLTIYPATYQEGETTWTTPVTFTGVAAGTTTVTIGNYQYTVNVAEQPPFNPDDYTIISNTGDSTYSRGKEVEHLILTPGKSYDLDLNGNYSSVSWSSNNTVVATVDSRNGTVSAESPGIATITANITTPDGNQGVKTVYVTVLDIGVTGRYDRDVEIYVNELRDSRLYYHQNRENNPYLVEVQEHTVFYMNTEGYWAMTFFGAPVNDNYAMTYMSAANNQDQTNWYVIEDNVYATSTTFYANRGSLEGTYGYNQSDLTTMINNAKAAGADGGFWFTRDNGTWNEPGGSTTDCQAIINVVSEPLPTVEKEITSVSRNGEILPYREGMAIYVGDVINYTITVHRYASEYNITYSDATLREDLAPFTNGSYTREISSGLNSGNSERDFTYNASYEVKSTDINKELTNTVTFTYTYAAQYSKGSMTASSQAAASISVVAFEPDDYVVDFGLPVKFDFSNQIDETMGEIVFAQAFSSQGAEVTVDGQTAVTYKLLAPLNGKDTVTVTLKTGAHISFDVYPATTVYYDGSFVTGLTDLTSSNAKQTASAVGSGDHYGYEDNYSNAASGTLPATGTVEFSFTGTGVDVYANTTNDSCYVAVSLYDSSNTLVGLYLVDTAMKDGTTDYTKVPTTISYNVPIVSLTDLTHGTYTVEIQRIDPQKGDTGRDDVDLSGFRVYGTMADGNNIYSHDNEDSPTFIEVRNSVLDTLGKTMADLLTNQFNQVYEAVSSGTVSASIAGLIGNPENPTDAEDFLFNGPKNEVYLTKDQTLTITVPTAGTYQLGLKSLNASNGTVSVNNTDVNVTNVDMFYTVDAPGGTIIITNNSDTFISVSMLKSLGN